ncbi:hypothetical protein MTR67_051766 [Solanum verrucosum]|uniref:Reverse transcriptase/retrotransposon-derived protein RNase H-like domain-containing protein n=1 Tax=Solanum verrucosum TaxID=315347 RepID=A0AAF1A0F0_SOLVR|nr:hypothetical protein MTR67_051766 [Solanum verrucosum]
MEAMVPVNPYVGMVATRVRDFTRMNLLEPLESKVEEDPPEFINEVRDADSKVPIFELVPIVNDFMDVFPNDLLSVPPERKIDFVLFVRKNDGFLRMCIDYRMLKKVAIKNMYPLRSIDDLYDQIQGENYFIKINLYLGYHLLTLKEGDMQKMTFLTRRFVEEFSPTASPLTAWIQKKFKFAWSEAFEKSFQELKDRLTSAPVLTLPEGLDGFAVYCDASTMKAKEQGKGITGQKGAKKLKKLKESKVGTGQSHSVSHQVDLQLAKSSSRLAHAQVQLGDRMGISTINLSVR